MFTGIIEERGRLAARETAGDEARLVVAAAGIAAAGPVLGESIAVQGVCLTVVAALPEGFAVDASPETLRLTTLGRLPVGAPVNLERALRADARLGGHLVSGHVDGVATVRSRVEEGRSTRFTVDLPAGLGRFVAAKGSLCLDGISLTVNRVEGLCCELQLIPHTLAVTTAGEWRPGDALNVEVDLLARYLDRLLAAREAGTGAP